MVKWALDGLEVMNPGKAAPFKKAISLGKQGGDRKSEAFRENQGSNTTLKTDRGADYTIARLKRDDPELAKRVVNGELSPNAAAILSPSPMSCRTPSYSSK